MLWLVLSAQIISLARPDSAEVLRTARLAQARFEDFRIERLPRYRGGRPGGRCDEVVGRFCFWHDDDDSWTPVPEPAAIQAERLQLLRTLDRLHALSPSDPWITGQLVRYLMEAKKPGEAQAVARQCRPDGWWCRALAGLALHAAGNDTSADSAFGQALAAMPDAQRCAWRDLSPILDGLRSRYRKLSCDQRAALERRFWWLADPLYMVPGNEARAEHYARRVMNALQDHARSAYGLSWGPDLEELLIRYGWPVAWERQEPEWGGALRPGIISHNERNGRYFLPPARFMEAPNTILPDEWDLDPDRPVYAYAPPYATAFHDLPHQTAIFRRGDSMVVVVKYDVRATGAQAHRPPKREEQREHERARKVTRVEAALILSKDENARPIMAKGTEDGPEGVMTLIAPAEPGLLSIETLDTADSVHAARARHWLAAPPPAEGITLSDPLLLRTMPADSTHPSLADVLPLVRSTAEVRRGESIIVFWETYGLQTLAQSFRVTLSVTQMGRTWLRRAAEWAGLAQPDPRYISISWEEPSSTTSFYQRAITLSMPNASPGTYLLEISVVAPGAATARGSREITILP